MRTLLFLSVGVLLLLGIYFARDRVQKAFQIGAVLYTEYVYPFQLAAIVLLIAIVAAISLTMRRRPPAPARRPPSPRPRPRARG